MKKDKICYLGKIEYTQYSDNELSRKMSIEISKNVTNKRKPQWVVGKERGILVQDSISRIHGIIFN